MTDRWEEDRALTTEALVKIARAQARGTLSARVSIRKYDKQIVLEGTSPKDRAWLLKTFGAPEITRREWFANKSGGQWYDRFEANYSLREPEPKQHEWHAADVPPRVEVWYSDLHECRRYHGEVGPEGKPKWRCVSCKKAMPVGKARELGLLPPLVRQRGTTP